MTDHYRRTLIACAVAALALAAPAGAQERCKTITDDAARLACYDVENDVLEITTEDPIGIGKWDKQIRVSPMTDDRNIYLRLESENQIRGRFGGPGNAVLWLRCMENTTAVLMDFNGHFMSDIQGYGRVEYRLDDAEMARFATTASTDNSTLGLWRGNVAIPFIKRLLAHERLILRATPYNESAVTATFDIRGIDEAVIELRETCGW